MFVRMSVEIGAPPEKVWPYLVVPGKTMKWFTHLKKFEYTGEKQGGAGSTFYWEEEAGGKLYKLHFITTEWIENRVFAYRMTSGDFFKSYNERWEIEATSMGSRFTFNDYIEFPYGPVGKIIGWFAARNARKSGREILENLKKLAEE